MASYPAVDNLAIFNPAQVPKVYSANARITNDSLDVDATITNNVLDVQVLGLNENGITTAPLKVGSDSSLQVSLREPLSAFGELVTINPRPRIQCDAIYGILSTDIDTQSATGGSALASDSLFTVQSGISIGGYGVLRSKNIITYRPGQAMRIRGTASFTSGVANSIQAFGAFNVSNGFFVGYQGTTFGLWRRNPGATAIYRLTITNGTGGNETHSITLNGVLFTVATTGALTTARVAEEIAENLNPTGWVSGVSPRSNGATITFIQNTPGATPGAFTYSSTGTATGTFAQIRAGVANDDTTYFVPQSSWNIDTLDGSNSSMNPSGELLDPTKLNVWQITIPYLGAGSIKFYRMDSESHLEAVHCIEYTNSFTVPSQSNPSYRVGWISASLGSTTNLTVKGASCAGFVDGDIYIVRNPFSFSGTITAGTTEYVIFALRGRGEFATRNNQRQITLQNLSACLETANRICTVNIYLNPTLTGIVNWQFVNESLSTVEYASPATLTPSGGILIQSFSITNAPTVQDLSKLDIRLTAFDTLAITAKTVSNTSPILCSLNWTE
jgi:hypothetical protein